MVTHVVLCAGDPEDATLSQVEQIGKVDVSLVEDRDLACL
jgi:hypothetical protein